MPESEIARYRGAYDGGWEALRRARYRRQLEAGLFDAETTPLPANSSGRAWREVERRAWEAAHMEVHAAMVTRMDRGIGRVVSKLEELGVFLRRAGGRLLLVGPQPQAWIETVGE